MKLNKLAVGMRIKNYKELCAILEEPVKAGNSKRAQIKEWERFFSYTKEGNAYIVREIYSEPLASSDKRIKHASSIEPVLLHILATSGTRQQTYDNWYQELGMVSGNLYDDDYVKDVCDEFCITQRQFGNLFACVRSESRKMLESSLSALKHRGYIDYARILFINKGLGLSEANQEEQRAYQAARDAVLLSIGKTEFSLQVDLNAYKRFRAEFSKYIKEKYDWENAYYLLRIIPKNLEVASKYINVDYKGCQRQLHDAIVSRVIQVMEAEVQNYETKTWKLFEQFGKESLDSIWEIDQSLYGTLMFVLNDRF